MPAPCRSTMAGCAGSNGLPPVPASTSRRLTFSCIVLSPISVALRGAQRLGKIVDNVSRRLDADREPHEILADAGGGQLRCVHLLMCGARRMDHERLRVADIGEVARQ